MIKNKFILLLFAEFYETMRIIVLLIRSKISSVAASGNRLRDGIRAVASSTDVSVTTRFINAETSKLCNSSSSPSSVSFRNEANALQWLGGKEKARSCQ